MYVKLEKYITREQEMEEVKEDPCFRPEPKTGLVTFCKGSDDLEAEIGSDLRIQDAFHRRDLAFDNANLVTFTEFKKWTTKLMKAYLREPPEGHATVGFEQILEADNAFFKFLAEATEKSGIKPVGEVRPLWRPWPGAATTPKSCFSCNPASL